jgi:GH15 family glucan-1,4-alpha-glucosidase
VNPYPPTALRDYAFLADGERGVLVGPRGEMAWMCFPSWHSPSVLTSLLGGKGVYALTPADERYVWGGYYEQSTLIWNERWVTDSSLIECREALAFPGDPEKAVILRQVRAVHGECRVRVHLDLRSDYDRRPLDELSGRQGIWEGRSGSTWMRWTSGPGARRAGDNGLTLELTLTPGDHYDLVLELATSADKLAGGLEPADAMWRATEDAWARHVPDLGAVPARRDAAHAYAVMRGLTCSSGAMAAAATTSLPERAEAGRNYDYRYAWIRDQCFGGQAVAVVDAHPLLDGSIHFISERLHDDGPKLQPAYLVHGGRVPDEKELTHLPGYPGGKVKLGNWVNQQFQLDSLGECLLLFATAARHDHLDSHHWSAVEIAAGTIEARWREPDAGIWELHNQLWAHSRLICAAGLRQIAHYATEAQAGNWTALADHITAEVGSTCLHPTGRWQRSPTDDRVDAALLMPSIRGAVPAQDPRTTATLAAIEDELCEDGYIYRFRHDERPLAEAEGAFSLCGFQMALAYEQQGRHPDAIAWFERNRASCGSPGLLTEEFDVGERQLRGNIPQAFVHALLLETAVRLAEA